MKKQSSLRKKLRIILAITYKDLLDAVKNRTILTLTFGILILMLSARALPLMLAARGITTLAIYDPGSTLDINKLTDQDDIQIIPIKSQAEMESLLVESQQLIIGLVIPPETAGNSGANEIVLEGSTAHWVSQAKVRESLSLAESVLGSVTGQKVVIQIKGNTIFPTVDTGMHLTMVTQTATVMLVLMGIMLIPYLFLEEKEQHTLDALMVSPAGYHEMVAGKALAGGLYCLITAVVVVMFIRSYLVHWGVVVLVVLLGSAFVIVMGLLIGILIRNQATLGLWIAITAVILTGPSALVSFSRGELPPVFTTIASWSPAVAINTLFKISMSGAIPVELVWQNIIILITATLMVYTLVIWRVRQMDR